jgi:hypothetical protein
MSKFREYLLDAKEKAEAYLIEGSSRNSKTKNDYIRNAEEGLIVAFRLNFENKTGLKLTKVISGKIVENNQDDEIYIIETRNGLKYGVPYAAVLWVKTGGRWPKGIYEEMKQGSVEIEDEEHRGGLELGQLEDASGIDADDELDQ